MTGFPRDPTADTTAAHQSRVAAARRRASREAAAQLDCLHPEKVDAPGEVDGVKFVQTRCVVCGLSLEVKPA